jgi:hypothetical protein
MVERAMEFDMMQVIASNSSDACYLVHNQLSSRFWAYWEWPATKVVRV